MFIHNKSKKSQFRLDLWNARNHVVPNIVDKNLEGQAAHPPPLNLIFFNKNIHETHFGCNEELRYRGVKQPRSLSFIILL